MKMDMRQMKMHAARKPGQKANTNAQQEADEIEVSPIHN
jgi:hypothetical protein